MQTLPKGIEERLKQDPMRYLYLKEFYLRGAEVRLDSEEGLILVNSNGIGYISGSCASHPALDGIKLYMFDDLETAKAVSTARKLPEAFTVYNLYYLKKEAPCFPLPPQFRIRKLTIDDLQFVLDNYDNPGSFESHIRGRIAYGMLGMEVDGELAAFIGIHEEGTMGMLEVLPKFRRRGIAEILEAEIIRMELEKGHIPYCQVVPTNEPSFRLQDKLGLVRSDFPVYWVG